MSEHVTAASGRAANHKTAERGLRVLCLDGGGIRSISQVAILEVIETLIGKKIFEEQMFDLICGSGYGGLLSIAIGVQNKSQDDCRRMLYDLAGLYNTSRYNPVAWYRWMSGQGYYSTTEFTQCLNRHLGELPWSTLSWLNPKVCAVSGHSHLNGRTTPCLWRTYRHHLPDALPGFNNCDTTQAARATASTPGYFSPFIYGPDRLQFVDGTVIAPNPTELALFETSKLWPDREVDLLVSIGTGITSHVTAKPVMLYHGLRATDIEAEAQITHQAVSQWVEMSGKVRTYVRLDPTLPKGAALNEPIPALDELERRAKSYLELEAGDQLDRLRSCYSKD